MSPWRTIRGRHVFIRGRRRGYYSQPRAPSTTHRTTFSRRPYQRRLPRYANSGQLIKFKLPVQQALADKAKGAAVEAVRAKYGDVAATAAGFVFDQAVSRAIAGADWSVEGEAHVSRTGVRGTVKGEFAVPLTGVKLPEGVPIPEVYVKASFRYSGSLRTGSLKLAMVRTEAGVRADLPGGQTGVSVSSAPPGR